MSQNCWFASPLSDVKWENNSAFEKKSQCQREKFICTFNSVQDTSLILSQALKRALRFNFEKASQAHLISVSAFKLGPLRVQWISHRWTRGRGCWGPIGRFGVSQGKYQTEAPDKISKHPKWTPASKRGGVRPSMPFLPAFQTALFKPLLMEPSKKRKKGSQPLWGNKLNR